MKKSLSYLAVILLTVISASYFASSYPDGLEFVAEKLGFIETAAKRSSLMTDYAMPRLGETPISTAIAGIIGLFLCFGLFWLISRLPLMLNKKHL